MMPTPTDMDQKESNEYLSSLIQGKRPPPAEPIEAQSAANFRQLSNQIAALQLRLQKLNADREKVMIDIPRLSGQQEAYGTILLAAENGRRKIEAMKKAAALGKKKGGDADPTKPGEPDGIDLEGLRKATGAKKLEVVSLEGDVVASTEAPDDDGMIPKSDEEPGKPALEPGQRSAGAEPATEEEKGDVTAEG